MKLTKTLDVVWRERDGQVSGSISVDGRTRIFEEMSVSEAIQKMDEFFTDLEDQDRALIVLKDDLDRVERNIEELKSTLEGYTQTLKDTYDEKEAIERSIREIEGTMPEVSSQELSDTPKVQELQPLTTHKELRPTHIRVSTKPSTHPLKKRRKYEDD